MTQNPTHIFPQDFLQKLINFSNNTLANLFILCRESVQRFVGKELYTLDPLVCENACHIRAFVLWQMVHKYQSKQGWFIWHAVIESLDEIIQKIHEMPPIDERTKQTIGEYLQEHSLLFNLDNELIFDLKFIFLSRLLTLTKKQFPSSSFMLNEKTCLNALNGLGLVHNKIKSLVSSAQKELSAMSCLFIMHRNQLCNHEALNKLLSIRYDNHKRSYLPQYSSAKVILFNALQNNIPFIVNISRFVQCHYHDRLSLGFMPSADKKDYTFTEHTDDSQTAIICEGVINYSEVAELPEAYLDRLNRYSLIQLLLANFAAHPQFSGNLRDTPCIYDEAIGDHDELNLSIAREWDEFKQHAYFAKKEGCSLENPGLLFLNHIYCDRIASLQENDITAARAIEEFMES